MEQDKANALSIDTYIGRQPIFDASKRTRAYELLYRGSANAESADFTDDHIATLQVIANTLFNTDDEGAQNLLFVNYSKQAILDEVPMALPPRSVIKIKEHQVQEPEILTRLKRLRNTGYMVALDDFSGKAGDASIYALADIIILDFLRPCANIEEITKAAKDFGSTVMGKRIESKDQFELALSLDVDLFQGFYFHKPEIIPGKRFTTSESSRLNLLEFLRDNDPDFDKLSQSIQIDPALTHRVLFYINSPYFGMRTEIATVKRAISLLGWNKVRNLLYMVVLTDAASPLSNELFITSATRAMFLKRVAEEHSGVHSPEELYIFGLLSLLDAIFQVPMAEVMANIALDQELKTMLIEKTGDLYQWIELAMAFELGEWDRVDHSIKVLKLDFVKVSKGYYDALKWVNSFYGTLT